MKHIRLLCASLLMLLCMISVAVIFAADRSEAVYAWQRVTFSATDDVTIFDAGGTLLQMVTPQSGQAVSKLLPEGEYYAICDTACTEFALHADRSIEVLSGCGWAEGNVLYFSTQPVGSIRVELMQKERNEFILIGAGIERSAAAENGKCQFFALPYGNYKLYSAGVEIANLSIDANKPNLSLILT